MGVCVGLGGALDAGVGVAVGLSVVVGAGDGDGVGVKVKVDPLPATYVAYMLGALSS